MKKIFYLAVLITAVFTSCQKDALVPEEPLSGAPQNTIKPLEASDEMLSFNSEEEMYAEIERLMLSNDARSITKTTHSGFTSINDIYEQALADLDIVDEMESIEMLDQVKEKYQPYLLYNDDPADNEMDNPYTKTDFRLAYVCNKNGDVIINGVVKNFNTAKSAKETELYKLANPAQTKSELWDSPHDVINGVTIKVRDNRLELHRSKRQMHAFPYRQKPIGNNINIRMYGKKKSVFGRWRDYTTSFYVKYVSVEYGWSTPYKELLALCVNDKNTFHYLGDYKNRHILVGYTRDALASFRIYSQGTSGVSGVLRVVPRKLPYPSPW